MVGCTSAGDGGSAALEAIVGLGTAYEIDGADAAPPNVAAVLLAAQRARLAALAPRLEDVRPKKEWNMRTLDWGEHQTKSRAVTALVRTEWSGECAAAPVAWRAEARLQAEQMAAHDSAARQNR